MIRHLLTSGFEKACFGENRLGDPSWLGVRVREKDGEGGTLSEVCRCKRWAVGSRGRRGYDSYGLDGGVWFRLWGRDG
jgi:hypothetical protein